MTSLTYAANSIGAYVGADADVVGVSGTVVLPHWEGDNVYFFQTSIAYTPGIRQFALDSLDETLQRSKSSIGISEIYADAGAAATLSYDGANIVFISESGNTVQLAKVRASDLVLQATLGSYSSSLNPNTGIIAPLTMVGLRSGSTSYVMLSAGLNSGDVSNDFPHCNLWAVAVSAFTSAFVGYPTIANSFPDIRAQNGALLTGHGPSSGLAYLVSLPFVNGVLGAHNVDAIGVYSVSPTTLTKLGTFAVADVDATWTYVLNAAGVAYDASDGNLLIGVQTDEAVVNKQYIVKLSATTGAVLWKRAVNFLNPYHQSFKHSRINGVFHYLGSTGLVYHITTSDGSVSTETVATMAATGPQVSDDTTNSIIFYGSYSHDSGTEPAYIGAYMDTGGHHLLSQQWARFWFATTPSVTPAPGDIGGLALSYQRAWTFSIDGHTFYVLDLGTEGTFIFDTITSQWAKFLTAGYGRWNVQNGVMWGNRVVGGAIDTPTVWEVSASLRQDDGVDIAHAATGGVQTRSRTRHNVGAVRVTGSVGDIGSGTTSTLRLRFSDDNGKTWSNYFDNTLTQGDTSAQSEYRALGSFGAPGRIFELSDVGGPNRIDGVDADVDGLDDAAAG